MSASKTFVNYKSNINSFDVANERFLGIIQPGYIRGFDTLTLPTPGLAFDLEHTATGLKKVAIDGLTESGFTGVLLTKQGTIAHFEQPVTGLAVNTNQGETSERIDVVVFQHTYQASTAANLGSVVVVQGTPGAGKPTLPLPTQMVEIGTITLPAGVQQLQPSYWKPADPVSIGGFPGTDETSVNLAIGTLQQARQRELLDRYETARQNIDDHRFFNGPGNPNTVVPPGLYITRPTIDATDPTAVVIGSFAFYADGYINVFTGGTYDLSVSNNDYKGFTNSILLFQTNGVTTTPNPEQPWNSTRGVTATVVQLLPTSSSYPGAFAGAGGIAAPALQGVILICHECADPNFRYPYYTYDKGATRVTNFKWQYNELQTVAGSEVNINSLSYSNLIGSQKTISPLRAIADLSRIYNRTFTVTGTAGSSATGVTTTGSMFAKIHGNGVTIYGEITVTRTGSGTSYIKVGDFITDQALPSMTGSSSSLLCWGYEDSDISEYQASPGGQTSFARLIASGAAKYAMNINPSQGNYDNEIWALASGGKTIVYRFNKTFLTNDATGNINPNVDAN